MISEQAKMNLNFTSEEVRQRTSRERHKALALVPQRHYHYTRASIAANILFTIVLIYTCLFQLSECLREPRFHDTNVKCHSGWTQHGQKCYKVNYNPRNLEIAKTRCHDLSAQLAFVEDETTKEEETTPGTNSTVFTFLTTITKNDSSNRVYYVSISLDLLRQYKLRAQQEAAIARSQGTASVGGGGGGGDLSEHVDLDYSLSDLWIPSDDKNFLSIRFNATSFIANEASTTPGFVLAFSRQYGRWGLLAISPSRKASSICEMPISSATASQPAANVNGNQHQVIEANKRTVEQLGQDNLAASASNSSPSNAAERTPTGLGGTRTSTQQDLSPLTSSSASSSASLASSSRRSEKETGASSQAPELIVQSALFRDLPQNQSVVLGSTAELRCSAIEQDSTLVWTFNGRNLTQSNRVRQHQSGWLRIEQVRISDGGNYTCTIHSVGMTESRSAKLEIIERPHQPEYIMAELLDKLSTSVRIRWTPGFNGNSPITKYQVEMRTVNSETLSTDGEPMLAPQATSGGQWELAKANISADQTSVIIADLKPARRYIFRIKATNRVGTGDPSLPTRNPIEVPVQPPSMAPENLTATPLSSVSIAVQWAPPPADSQNGPIKAYKIRHRLAGYASDTDWYTSDIPEASHLNYVLDDLITWQNYEIQLAAENDKGVGPFSSSIFVRTKEGRPDRGPRNVQAEAVSSTLIKVTWNPPPPQHIYGINQGYRVQLWLDALQNQLAKETSVSHNSLTPLQTATIDSLLPYTEYHVTVKCYTSAGDGVPNEESIVVKTKQDLPEAVPVLEFADVLDKSLRVLWKPPNRVNGELVQYTLEYSETSSSNKRISKKFPAGITETKITDLTPQTSYIFKIFPHTDIGQGPVKVNSTTTSVPPVLPEPPSNLMPLNIGPYSVTIQFEPGFDGNAAIDRWIAEALMQSSNADYKPRWQNIYISTNHSHGGNTVVVRNLRPFTRYKIRLTPSNVAGASRYPSEPTSEFQTSQIQPEQAPRDLSVEDVRANSAVVHWSPLSNNLWLGQPRGYNLTWCESNNSSVLSQLINDTRADSVLVKDLEEYTEYVFRIYALNDAGASPPSEAVVIQTQEDVPSSGPTNVTATAASSSVVSISWNHVPKRHRNGIIRGYKIQYQAVKPDAPLQHRTIEDNSTKHATLNDLKPFTLYNLAVAAYTAAGDGVYSPVSSVQTLEDTPGLPQNLSSPTVSQTEARILWDPPEDPNGEIVGYKISYHSISEGNKDAASHDLNQNERTFKATNLKPDTHYVFTVTAKTREGWGQQASMLLYTYDSELRANLPFFRESWFVILCACSSVVITIIVTALLFIQTKSYKYKQDNAGNGAASQDRLSDAGFTIDDDTTTHYNNAFGLPPSNGNHYRRGDGANSQSTANFTLPKTPPRPHPGSVVYSDEDDGDDDVFDDPVDNPPVKSIASTSGTNGVGLGGSSGGAGTSHYDSSSDSSTEKPMDNKYFSKDSPEPNDDEYVNLNGGRIILDNMAGSRAPLPGFT